MEYTLIRSKRKTLCIEVKRDGTVLVRAPMRAPMRQIDAFFAAQTDWVQKKVAQQQSRGAAEQFSEQETAAFRAAAKAYIPPRVAEYSKIMGLTPTSVKITSAKTRFGSCSGKNGLCFSLYLMRYPLSAVDSVIVHELAHIRHHNHSKDFYRLIECYMPDYRERQKVLRG